MSSAESTGSRMSTPLLLVLGGVVVGAIAYVLFVFVVQGGPGAAPDELAGATPQPEASDVAMAPSETATEDATDTIEDGGVEPTFEVFSARDPFEQLVADTEAGSAGGVVDGTAPTSATQPQVAGAPVVDGSAPTTDATPTAAPPANGDPSQTTLGGKTILLEDVFTQGGVETALVVVDNEGYEATAGETVAGDVTVLDIAGNCATMRYEDRRFILCEGEQVTK